MCRGLSWRGGWNGQSPKSLSFVRSVSKPANSWATATGRGCIILFSLFPHPSERRKGTRICCATTSGTIPSLGEPSNPQIFNSLIRLRTAVAHHLQPVVNKRASFLSFTFHLFVFACVISLRFAVDQSFVWFVGSKNSLAPWQDCVAHRPFLIARESKLPWPNYPIIPQSTIAIVPYPHHSTPIPQPTALCSCFPTFLPFSPSPHDIQSCSLAAGSIATIVAH